MKKVQMSYGGIWSMPKPDTNGFCNDFYAARFMEGASNSCTREVSLTASSSDCVKILNPLLWTESIEVLKGRALASEKIPVTVKNFYTYDVDTGAYTLSTVAQASTFDSSDNSCRNALQEVVYNVFIKWNPADQISKTDYYSVASIEADVVV